MYTNDRIGRSLVVQIRETMVVVMVRSRCGRYRRLTVLFACIVVLTLSVYALINSLTDMSSELPQQQQQQPRRPVARDVQHYHVIINNSGSPRSLSSTLLRLAKETTTTESVGNSTSGLEQSTSDSAVDDTDTGVEQGNDAVSEVMNQGNGERTVRRGVMRLHLRPPKNIQYSEGRWQTVDTGTRHQVYVYSAFYDSRPHIDWPQVRVIAVAQTDVRRYGLCCLLWYRTPRLPDVVEISVAAIGSIISPCGQSVLEQFIFSCRVDRNKTNPPISVSLVTPHNFRLSNMLPVHVPERPGYVMEFGHCMSIMYWKQDPFRLVEWLEVHRMWGVGEVNIYTIATDNVTNSILRRYADSGFVKHRQSSGPVGGNKDILLNRSPVINDCLYRNMYRYRYVVCTDVDEMIVPASPYHNYSQMLAAADAVATQTNAIVHSYAFRNTYFFLDFGATELEPWYLLSQRSCTLLSIL